MKIKRCPFCNVVPKIVSAHESNQCSNLKDIGTVYRRIVCDCGYWIHVLPVDKNNTVEDVDIKLVRDWNNRIPSIMEE